MSAWMWYVKLRLWIMWELAVAFQTLPAPFEHIYYLSTIDLSPFRHATTYFSTNEWHLPTFHAIIYFHMSPGKFHPIVSKFCRPGRSGSTTIPLLSIIF